MINEQRFKMKQRDLYATMKLVAFFKTKRMVSAVRVEIATCRTFTVIEVPD